MRKYFIIGLCATLVTGPAVAGPSSGMIGGPGSEPEVVPPCGYSYSCGEGTGTPPSSGYVSYYSNAPTFAANTCSKSGSDFAGWWAYPSGNIYQPGDTLSFDVCNACMETGGTFIAVWVPTGTSNAPTSRAYVDSELDTTQGAFSGLGSSKLMTYPTSAGGTPGSRDIVTTLGTPNSSGIYSNTTDHTIATRGAIVAGINVKQNTLSGTSGYAVLNTGTAGELSEKAIYGSQTRYEDALVEVGTVNSAIIDAVNSELTPIDTDPNGRLWRVNDTVTLLNIASGGGGGDSAAILEMLTALVGTNGDGYCSKSSGGSTSGTCTTPPSNYGDWGVMFTYNDEPVQISGISACSSVDEELNMVGGIPTNQSGVQADYETSGSGAVANDNPPGGNCYCKMTDPNTSAARWVFVYSYDASNCANVCARDCAGGVLYYSDFRSAMFGSVQ